MHTHHYALLTLSYLVYASIENVVGGPWASPAQEHMDEVHDAELYKAVVESMKSWAAKQHDRHRTKREEPSVCYPELGCFEASGPFGYLDMLPSKPEEISTRFLMFPSHSSRRSGNTPGEFPFANISDALVWAKAGLNNSLPLKVMIHGFGSDCTHIWIYEMRSALMAVDDLNVICVDWGNGATLPNYVKAAANTRLVGKQLAMLLRGLVDKVGFSLRNIHLIGFSLGAHVAGFAGAELGNLSRITGLDPAGPLFESQDPRARLDQTDAHFVDVIHSNGENLILGGLGSWQPMGHVDFYPNGGRMQKGCSNIFVGAVSDIIWSSAVEGRSLCNHRRAYKFFTDSVSPRCHFPAFPCDSYDDFLAGKCFPCSDERKCGNMGYYADRSKGRGQLYLITRDEEPFCAHQYHIKIESTPSDVPIVSYGKIQITLIGDSLLNETFTLTRKEDEEMRLGSSVSRIIVPHPILLEPTKIQILYNAYSGWLTSGLLQWRIDKITLSDSYGRSASVCKKNLILDSGVPVVLPLYPGECNLPNGTIEVQTEVERVDYERTKNASKFVPTPVIKIGNEAIHKPDNRISFRDAFEIFNIPWTNDNNIGDSESEQSRAFNSRATRPDQQQNDTKNREVVEPILKPQANKVSRDFKTVKDEITEPILGPTTARTPTTRKQKNQRELVYHFYDVDGKQGNSEWVPSAVPTPENKWKRHDDSVPAATTSRVYNYNGEREEQDAFNAIVRTVQFLPQRLARMFEEAEKYARETILPLVSTYTPKFISDFIVPNSTPKYLPLHFDETFADIEELTTSTTTTISSSSADNVTQINETSTMPPTAITTLHTYIQKIARRNDDSGTDANLHPAEVTTTTWEFERSKEGRAAPDSVEVTTTPRSTSTPMTIPITTAPNASGNTKPVIKNATNVETTATPSAKEPKPIYINLPVIDEKYKEVKYIPLTSQEHPASETKSSEKKQSKR